MNPRDYAVLALDDRRLPGYPRQAFKRSSPVLPDDPRDRALAERLVVGVLKNLRLLERLIELHSQRPIDNIDPRARLILLVAMAQLWLFDRVPDHAVVTEAVQQTRNLREPGLSRASGFINAVLRKAVSRPDVSDKLPTRANVMGYCEINLSHPKSLVRRMIKQLGEADTLKLCEHDNEEAPLIVRLIGQDKAAVATQIADRPAIEVTPHEQADLVVVDGAKQSDVARWSEAGLAQPQDATSAAIVAELDVQPDLTVLDRCCGVGTKTQQLCELVGEKGKVFAVDAAGSRISTLRRLAGQRPIMANLTAKRAEWQRELPEDWPAAYDRILIDAPCSNSGVMARRPEARYQQDDAAVLDLPSLQRRLLDDAWTALAPGGLLAYATCSIWPDENGDVVRQFLANERSAELVKETAWLPSFDSAEDATYRDGGYVATLRKRS